MLTSAHKLVGYKMKVQNIMVLLLASIVANTGFAQYTQQEGECDGLPPVAVGSIDGTCVGLLVGTEAGFVKPRKTIQVPDQSQLLVTDMGGWSDYRGILWLVDFYTEKGFSGPYRASKLLEKLRLPHDIKLGDDGLFYLGEAHQISRFKLTVGKVNQAEVVISNLPFEPDAYQHPLTSFVFQPNNDLIVNVGSKTDSCTSLKTTDTCDEVTEVGLRHYTYNPETLKWRSEYDLYATGLRNSMALVAHSSGTLLQGENSSDIKAADEPYEEINIIKKGGFYGWPYCLNRNFDQATIANGCKQKNYIPPHSLMPPHTAPLDMIYYNSNKLPMLTGKLLVSWHGYRVVGNRLAAYAVDPKGIPYLTGEVSFNRDPIAPATDFTRHKYRPEGGSSADAQHIEVIHQWNTVPEVRPEGAPVGLLELSDGSIVITDDKNKSLLRLAPGKPFNGPTDSTLAPDVSGFNYAGDAKDILVQRCSVCHIELHQTPGLLLNPSAWLRLENNKTVLEEKLTTSSKRMPPDYPLEDPQIKALLKAIDID